VRLTVLIGISTNQQNTVSFRLFNVARSWLNAISSKAAAKSTGIPRSGALSLDARGRERYTRLLDLLLALRRPPSAKNLDRAKVSDRPTSGLSPAPQPPTRRRSPLPPVSLMFSSVAATPAVPTLRIRSSTRAFDQLERYHRSPRRARPADDPWRRGHAPCACSQPRYLRGGHGCL